MIASARKSIETETVQIPDRRDLNYDKHRPQYYRGGLNRGEFAVAELLSDELDYHHYFIFNNIIVPSTYCGSSQIDHIVVSSYGIFVIESKDYTSWIFGNAKQKKWTQTFPNGKKYTLNNPLIQNRSHVYALQELFPKVPREFFIPMVVFTGTAEIKPAPVEGVYYLSQLAPAIISHTELKMGKASIAKITGALFYTSQTLDITPDMHVKNLKAKVDL